MRLLAGNWRYKMPTDIAELRRVLVTDERGRQHAMTFVAPETILKNRERNAAEGTERLCIPSTCALASEGGLSELWFYPTPATIMEARALIMKAEEL